MSKNSERNEETLAKARSIAKVALGGSSAFSQLSTDEQLAVYRDRVDEEYNNLLQADSTTYSQGMTDNRKVEKFSDLQKKEGIRKRDGLGNERIVDDSRFDNKNMDKAAKRMADMVDAVAFPDFVSDLLTGVFHANVQANIEQMEAYQNMLKQATKSLATYIQQITPEQSFAYLAENNSDEFGLSFPDMDDFGDEDSDKVILTDKNGNPVDTEDTKIKAKIMDAQIAMAKEQRALLRESVLMGVQRLVVDKGTIQAGLIIDISSKATVTKTEKGKTNRDRKSSSWHLGGGGTARGRRGGTVGLGITTSKGQKSEIRVASASGVQDDSLKAKMTGNVEITFRTDHFKLDNFKKTLGMEDEE